MLMAQANLPPDVYIKTGGTRPLAQSFAIRPLGLGAIAVPGRPGQPGIVFRGALGDGPGNGFYWGLALGALGMFGLMSILPKRW